MADELVKNILEAWQLPQLISTFEDEGIDTEAFNLLTEVEVEKLICKIGLRIKFLTKFKKYKEEQVSIGNSEEGNSTSTGSTASITEQDINELLFEVNEDNVTLLNLSSELMPPPPTPPPPPSPSPQVQKVSDIFPNGLEFVFQNNFDGRIVLSKTNIDNSCRKIISAVVVDHLLKIFPSNRIPSHAFLKAAEEIAALFPSEKPAIYFIPYKPKTTTSPQLLARGKLWSRYVNITRKVRSKLDVSETSDALSNNEIQAASAEHDSALEGYLTFLKTSIEPWEKVNTCWELTFLSRKKILKDVKVHEYIKLFPALQQPSGYTLLIRDFLENYKDKENCLYEKWPKYARAINSVASKNKIVLPDECEDLNILAIKLLPYIFPLTTLRNKNKKKSWRPSKAEVQNSFVLHILNSAEIHEKIEERKKQLRNLGLTLQPFFVIIGPLKGIEACYVVIDDHRYKVSTPLEALDVCFKIFFSLMAEYPEESKQVWLFIQLYIYDIKTNFDVEYPAISQIVSDLNNHLTD